MLSSTGGWMLGMVPATGAANTVAPAPAPAPAATPATGPVENAGGAVTTAPGATMPAGTQPAKAAPGMMDGIISFLPMILIDVQLYFVLFRGKNKEEKSRKKQIEAMKKGDEVLLISGKFGKVVDIRDDRVVVKVDEANNVKETYLKSAIQKVVGGEEKK